MIGSYFQPFQNNFGQTEEQNHAAFDLKQIDKQEEQQNCLLRFSCGENTAAFSNIDLESQKIMCPSSE